MKKASIILLIFATATFLLSALWVQASETELARPNNKFKPLVVGSMPSAPAAAHPLFIGRTNDWGTINIGHQMITGPLSCTSLGDPYSPHSSPTQPGTYTYRYRIQIPESYYVYNDEVRIEIFDPDSYNANTTGNVTVSRTDYAINQGLSPTVIANCNNDAGGNNPQLRTNRCLLKTGEEALVAPPVLVDNINPFWFVRVDENRAPVTCTEPAGGYDSTLNTRTFYELSYLAQSPTGSVQKIPIVSYSGRIDNSHDTDLRWVTPGADNYDDTGNPIVIPTTYDFTPTQDGFEITFDTDTPDIAVIDDCIDGGNCIYLDLEVTTTGGSSVNGFDFWAGPATDVDDYPSNVNERNVFILNAIYNGTTPTHNSAGIILLADQVLPQSSHFAQVVERPLTYLSALYAGHPISVTLFDIDSGSQAPITFTLDTIHPADWSVTFGISGTIDPDGVPANSRCFPNCNNQFITPTYVMTIPNDVNFVGGTLLMSYKAGIHDNHLVSLSKSLNPLTSVTISGPLSGTVGSVNATTFTADVSPITATTPITYIWHATTQQTITHVNGIDDDATFSWLVPYTYTLHVTASNGFSTVTDTHQIIIYPAAPIPGCASFPISIYEGVRAVYPPNTFGDQRDFPDTTDFHPSSPKPLYAQFPYNVPDVPLENAQEGYIYKIERGLGAGVFNWLIWNLGIPSSANTLLNSLSAPGNSTDYINYFDGGQPTTPYYPWVVRGYVNPFDDQDLILNPSDWLRVESGNVHNTAVLDAINAHALNGRELRLPVWGGTPQSQGGEIFWQMAQLGVFRLHGHNLTGPSGASWLLVEFVRWDTAVCTEGQYPVAEVDISGVVTGSTHTDYDFTATVVPTLTTQPITYTWQATGQAPLTNLAGISDTITLNWATPGVQTIIVTAENAYEMATAVHTITLTALPSLTSVTINGPVTSTLDSFPWPTFTAVSQPITATQPITYQWQATAQLPITNGNGLSDTVTFRWPVPHTYTVVVTASNGFSTVTDTHQIVIHPATPIPGCASFPIAIHEGVRSVYPPGTGTGNDYPAPGDFHLNSPKPYYFQFPNTIPDVPLHNAQEGTVYKVQLGTGAGTFGWLVWNDGINPNLTTLINSLTSPGNSIDYRDYGDSGQPATPIFPWVVRGYVNPFDVTDLLLNVGDWLKVATGTFNANAMHNTLNYHAYNGSELRLPIWDQGQGQGGNTLFHTVDAAVFRLHGYNLAGNPFLLAEFVRWDTAVCTIGQYPPSSIDITGPITGTTGLDYAFTATIVPTLTTQPLAYTWQADEQATIVQTNGITDTAVFQWLIPGTKTITVTASNGLNTVTATHNITISQPLPEPIIGITLTGSITGLVDVAYEFTAVLTPTTAQQPITYTWQATDQNPITHTGGITDTATFTWNMAGTKTITITANNGLNTVTTTHTITISQPLPEPIIGITLTGPITGLVDVAYEFTAVLTPTIAQQPITYTWQAIDQNPITHTGGITDAVTFTWPMTGTKTITVTADDGVGEPVTAVHTITLVSPPNIWNLHLPLIIKAKP